MKCNDCGYKFNKKEVKKTVLVCPKCFAEWLKMILGAG